MEPAFSICYAFQRRSEVTPQASVIREHTDQLWEVDRAVLLELASDRDSNGSGL